MPQMLWITRVIGRQTITQGSITIFDPEHFFLFRNKFFLSLEQLKIIHINRFGGPV